MNDRNEAEFEIGVWAIIPARGGSKGIPRKNLAPVGGVSLLGRAIRACVSSNLVTKTIVSTDDHEMATVGEENGAVVIWRPGALASDTSSSESVVRHVLETFAEQDQAPPRFSLLVQCTSPFLSVDDVDAVIDLLQKGTVDSCFTVARSHRFLWKSDPSGMAIPVNHDARKRLPRQSVEPEYVETGAVYGFNTAEFVQESSRFLGRIGMVEVESIRSLEIDDQVDLTVARALHPVVLNEERGCSGIDGLPTVVKAVVFDFDGVMTNNKVTIDENGMESVVANRGDGLGISLLRENTNLLMLVISTETNEVVRKRCTKLNLDCMLGVRAKDAALLEWLRSVHIDPSECIYVGNDGNDIRAMEVVGCAVAPSDAHPSALSQADIVLSRKGGEGAVRELADLLLKYPGTAGLTNNSYR
jgi:YrbI family 3-deoxy-D-manno-octulosonate 8-phosphate phosphatase